MECFRREAYAIQARMRWTCVLALLGSLAFGGYAKGSPRAKEALERLIGMIPSVAEGGPGISHEETKLARMIQAYGPSAIPHLLPLLKGSDRAFVGYILRDLEGLREEHLETLIDAHRQGAGWIPPAIARVGTKRAIQYLVDDLKAKPAQHTQVTWALKIAGRKAAVPLVQAMTAAPVSDDFASVVCVVLRDMGNEAATAVEPLLQVALDKGLAPGVRAHAVRALGCVGSSGQRAIAHLRKVAQEEPSFAASVDQTVVGIGSAEAVPILVDALRKKPEVQVFRRLAEMRSNARDAGPVVVEFLDHADWELRSAAARTLGFIGDRRAIAALIKALGDDDDWHLVIASAESLGRLGAAEAHGPLRGLETHWFWAVREAARTARSAIAGKHAYTSRGDNFALEFLDYQHPPRCDPAPGSPLPSLSRGPKELGTHELEPLEFDTEVIGYGVKGRVVHPTKQRPTCGLRVANGFLVGADRGEWGGELVHMMRRGKPKKLLDENIHGIHQMKFGIVAVTGLAHLILNDGMLFLVTPLKGGGYRATRWKRLPGAPRVSGFTKDGRLLISCSYGDVIVTPDGHLASP